ncbi:OsmC family protein [Arcicella rigui]|uniref:OsmC family protein n=1 Tax=Arcicella rigui TaxID=797020 RepID=A0ABU5Q678_9BACT|nr:OsmC family protein [Arcicella rigui]MEA5137934.1 OsmC family protein [Arcicella rigui]
MPTVKTSYLGDLRTESIHLQSGSQLVTDAPTDNMGKGEAFSPTDLLATATGTCMLTTMAIVAQRDGIELAGSSAEVTKIMSQTPPRKVARLEINLQLKTNIVLTEEQIKKLENTAHKCPVSLSLHPEVEQVVSFEWI